MMIRNANRNISVAVGHGYTLQKVKFAVNFVEKAGRNTTIQDWVDAYNYIKDANENAQGCQACKAAKFTAAVRNYARYGYMTLLNEGYSPSDFEERNEPVKVDEISKVEVKTAEDELLENALESMHNVQETIENDVQEVVSTVTETAGQGEPTVELPIVEKVQEATSPQTCNEEKQVDKVAEQKPKVRKKKK